VLFVSHNMNAVETLCQRVARLDQGKLVAITDDLRGAITAYMSGSGHNPRDRLVQPR
jgi:ABC-type polysaccharide/polyol phosphate transport system ATPase subunit